MKKVYLLLAIALLVNAASWLMRPSAAFAQVVGTNLSVTSGDHTTCVAASVWCMASDGLWRKLASDTVQVRVDVAQTTGVVLTVNGHAPDTTGNVKLTVADVKPIAFTDITGRETVAQEPTTRSCPVTSLTVGTTDTLTVGTCQ